ncbi:MAG: 1-deoxy-D-xylulose-5-phosphate reductoisomerase [Pyrinomonadaceae bacterium]
MKGLSILGSTGSIGCNSLRVVEALRGEFRVVALGAGRNVAKLVEQIAQFQPALVAVENDECAGELAKLLRQNKISAPQILTGERGMIEVATHDGAQTIVAATVGAIGLVPTLAAIETGKRVALANKETLVMAGDLMTRAAAKSKAEILPVDSEHNALHQCLRGENVREVKRLILTASGGPFRNKTKREMDAATIEEAMRHPTWSMGAKITIDSATLMNKGLEVIEAHWLFGFDAERISIVVHPESIVHSMIELVDNSIIAQMGVTDMRHAIQYALTYPERQPMKLPPLDLTKLSALHFEEPDTDKFPCLAHAYRALKQGGTSPSAMNAANEEAVSAFLNGKIRLTEISQIIADVLDTHETRAASTLETILQADREARKAAKLHIERLSQKSPIGQNRLGAWDLGRGSH